jgi:hypothetical protein
MKLRILVSSMLAAGLLGAGSAAIAQPSKAPIRLTDAQMDQIVAGTHGSTPHSYFEQSTGDPQVSTQWFRGYSTKEVSGPGPGTSSIESTTVTTTTISGTLLCTGAYNSCFTGSTLDLNNLNGHTVNNTITTVTPQTTTTTTGPGQSPSGKIFQNQGRI